MLTLMGFMLLGLGLVISDINITDTSYWIVLIGGVIIGIA